MPTIKYSKAPISEVIFGVIFNTNALFEDLLIFKLLEELRNSFPLINTHPTQSEEEVLNGIILATPFYEKAGFSTYRLSSSDGRFQILLQQDLITFHWTRTDKEDVGNYPGFSSLYKSFIEIYDSIIIKNKNVLNKIKHYYLGYVDRINLEDFKEFSLKDFFKISMPTFNLNNKEYVYENFISRFSQACEEVGGYSISGLNTIPTPIGRILIVDNKVKGLTDKPIDIWFQDAHEIQVSFFENLFSNLILEKWQ